MVGSTTPLPSPGRYMEIMWRRSACCPAYSRLMAATAAEDEEEAGGVSDLTLLGLWDEPVEPTLPIPPIPPPIWDCIEE